MSNVFADFAGGLKAFEAPIDARLAFMRRTYLHLTAAIGLLVTSSWAFYEAHVAERMARWLTTQGPVAIILLLVGLIAGTWFATRLATTAKSQGLQYVGLAGYALLMSLLISPLLTFAVEAFPGRHLLEVAAGLTIFTFGGLSAYVLTTKKDLSFLGPIIGIGFLVVFGAGIAGLIFGFSIAIWYAAAMIVLAAGSILYETSNVLHRYRTDQHVAAALCLFASVVMLFVQILQLLIELQGGGRRRE